MKSIWSTPLLDALGQNRMKSSKIKTSRQKPPSPTFRAVQLANYPRVVSKNGNQKNLLTMKAPLNTSIVKKSQDIASGLQTVGDSIQNLAGDQRSQAILEISHQRVSLNELSQWGTPLLPVRQQNCIVFSCETEGLDFQFNCFELRSAWHQPASVCRDDGQGCTPITASCICAQQQGGDGTLYHPPFGWFFFRALGAKHDVAQQRLWHRRQKNTKRNLACDCSVI